MKRRRIGAAAAAVAVLVLAALYAQKKPADTLLVQEWAAKSSLERPPTAVLIEFGSKDLRETDWSGRATVAGGRVVHREGYRFRPTAGDKLTDPDGWEAKSHRPLRAPAKQPAISKMESLATVGIVLHLADLKPDATLTVEPKASERGKATVPLKDVMAGQPQQLWDGLARVRLISTATPVAVDRKTENDFPAACYGPDGSLWVAYVGYHIQDEARRIEQKPFREQPKDFGALYTPEFHDQVFARRFSGGKWGEPVAVTDDRQDIVRCALAAEGVGGIWVAYSASRNGEYGVSVRKLDWLKPEGASEPRVRLGKEQRLGSGLGEVNPVLCTDQAGGLRFACQSLMQGGRNAAGIRWSSASAGGAWDAGGAMGSHLDGSSFWHPALAAGPDGTTALAYDHYGDPKGDQDVQVLLLKGQQVHGTKATIATSRFEARPSICYDPKGRLWVAYEEGPELWGKDYGALDGNDGQPLYSSRSIRVVCFEDGKLMKPVAELPTSDVKTPKIPFGNQGPGYERNENRYAYPKIGIDGKGRVWLTYRQKFGTRTSTHPGSYWLTFARRLDGDRWTEPIELHHSCGLLDHRPVLLPHKDGGLLVIHNTDGRYTTPEEIHNQVWMSHIDLSGDPVEPKLVPHEPGTKKPELVERAKREAEAVKRIRDYRVEHNGQKLRLLRGEFHRHTEISWDGGPDGSLEDMFRYAIDAAQMDWIGNGDHDSGGGREYSWWLIQKFTDAYTVPGRFTGMFTYERSVAYPHGHRNCVFARRGVRTLPRLADPDSKQPNGIHADDTKMLYRYLNELGGICASHTSATSMGTDWRDNDPRAEPLVEIYQGDRMSYEKEGAPRAGYDPKGDKEPANVAGWFPKGFVNLALGDKGYKLGFQASSDHWSTHISYCIVLAEKNDRESILEAMRKRHAYGATDDIICDVRSGPHLMGDEVQAGGPPKLEVKVVGTSDLGKVEVLRDSTVVAELPVNGRECAADWTDPRPAAGVHYYYVRVQQKDGELAWTSPMWIGKRN